MARGKKIVFKLKGITAEVECSKCGKFKVKLDETDFHANESECSLCGSHGSIYFYFTCPKCKKYDSIEINSW
jgi:ssDNA-binding Zn-finger/Zn-ribbon topoisomerase 1